jgi:hypothetical protein
MAADHATGYAVGVCVSSVKSAALAGALEVLVTEARRVVAGTGGGLSEGGHAVQQRTATFSVLQTDNHKGFEGPEFRDMCHKLGVAHRRSAPYLHTNQWVVESLWKFTFQKVRCMLIAADLPCSMWTHAFLHSVHLWNNLPSKGRTGGLSPLEVLTGRKPVYSDLKIFGSEAFVYLDPAVRSERAVQNTGDRRTRQLAPSARRMLWVGVDAKSTASKFVDPNDPTEPLLSGQFRVNEQPVLRSASRDRESFVGNLLSNPDTVMPEEGLASQLPAGERTLLKARVGYHKEDKEYYGIVHVSVRLSSHNTHTAWVKASSFVDGDAEQAKQLMELLAADEEAIESLRPIFSVVYVQQKDLFSDKRKKKDGVLSCLVTGVDPGPAVAAGVEVVVLSDGQQVDVPRGVLHVAPRVLDACDREGGPQALPPEAGEQILLQSLASRFQMQRFEQYGSLSSLSVIASGDQVYTLPKSVKQALDPKICPDYAAWRVEIGSEVKGIIDQETFAYLDVDELPSGVSTPQLLFKFKLKTEGGVVTRRKVRAVAQGQKQVFGKEFGPTWSDTPQIDSIHAVLAVAVNLGLPLYHMDVKRAFLHSEIGEYDIYMEMPSLPADIGFPKRFGKALKSIYGFKQAPRDWRRCADALLKSMGFKSSSIDASLYYLYESETGLIFILCLFVDDFLSACNSEKRYKQFVADFNAKYECVNLGELRQYVGMEFKRDDVKYGEGTLAISRKHAVLQVIEKFGLVDAKPRVKG